MVAQTYLIVHALGRLREEVIPWMYDGSPRQYDYKFIAVEHLDPLKKKKKKEIN